MTDKNLQLNKVINDLEMPCNKTDSCSDLGKLQGTNLDACRLKYNKKILSILSDYIETYPEVRFIQMLWRLGIINSEDGEIEDRFFEEPKFTLGIIQQKGHTLWRD